MIRHGVIALTLAVSCGSQTALELSVATSDAETGWWVVIVATVPPTADLTERKHTIWRFPSDLLFESGSSAIDPAAPTVLREFAAGIREDGVEFVIVGHTDNTGTVEYNERLALDRAAAVRIVLVNELGVPAELISVDGRGQHCPIASNETPTGRAKNRRVEIFERGDEPPCNDFGSPARGSPEPRSFELVESFGNVDRTTTSLKHRS